jgi:hypothetical protein
MIPPLSRVALCNMSHDIFIQLEVVRPGPTPPAHRLQYRQAVLKKQDMGCKHLYSNNIFCCFNITLPAILKNRLCGLVVSVRFPALLYFFLSSGCETGRSYFKEIAAPV